MEVKYFVMTHISDWIRHLIKSKSNIAMSVIASFQAIWLNEVSRPVTRRSPSY